MAPRRKKRRSRKPQQHEISFRIPRADLGIVDAKFVVRRDGELMGTLLVSRGAIEWQGAQKQHRRKLGWENFSKLMLAKGRRRPKPRASSRTRFTK